METVYISWNWPNWITIVLMAALGFVVLGFASSLWAKYGAGTAAAVGA